MSEEIRDIAGSAAPGGAARAAGRLINRWRSALAGALRSEAPPPGAARPLAGLARRRPPLPVGLIALGLLALFTAAAWWWVVYSQVVGSAALSVGEAAPCLVGTSDLCSLAQALCRGDHLLGIRRYSPDLFWIGIAATSLGALLPARRRG